METAEWNKVKSSKEYNENNCEEWTEQKSYMVCKYDSNIKEYPDKTQKRHKII